MTPSATVRRAILATIDRVRADERVEVARADADVRRKLELEALRAVPEDEEFAYEVGVTNTFAELQLARR